MQLELPPERGACRGGNGEVRREERPPRSQPVRRSAGDLAEMLTNLPGIYVNFDPASMILYGKGDPVKAVKATGRTIKV